VAELLYTNGLAVLRRVREGTDDVPDFVQYDPRLGAFVAPGHRYAELRSWGAERGVEELTPVGDVLDAPLFDPRKPRDYQRDALDRWRAAGGRGSVVLPTGAGKTLVAIHAIHQLGRGAVVLAPTRALVSQWFAQLADAFGGERVGAWYADEKDIRSITVTTYHSAFAFLEQWGSRFELLVCDEVHHLSDTAEGDPKLWHDALRIAPAALRLGLTATYPDGRDAELRRLVGPVVYRRSIGEMADAELARFAIERRFVPLSPNERARYDRLTERYESFETLERLRGRFSDPGEAWRAFMALTRRSPSARRAFRAYLARERLVMLAEHKLAEVSRILRMFPVERAILFCGSTDAARWLSRELAVPMIGAETPASERKSVLDAIARGDVRAVVSVRVLDEGWDVPAAKLGIVLGDSTRGSPRQHAQRLGRLLRKQGEAVASLYEIVAADTYEFFRSQKRGTGVRDATDPQLGLGV
jgi:superfamily II DNA or RNA helicase